MKHPGEKKTKRMQTIRQITVRTLIASVVMTGTSLLAEADGTIKTPTITVDASQKMGSFRPINGVNGGPKIRVGTAFDNRAYFKAFDPPFIRLHDCPYADLDTVDIHAIFPDFDADENDPKNYKFEKTDEYIRSIIQLKSSEIIYRLGESIEHGQYKYYTHPPADFKKWARICCNIVRHYNMGWANGFEWNIQRWEIWNEPSGPSCWSGTMEQYFELYRETAVALKKLDPALMVGGPGWAGPLGAKGGSHKAGRDFLAFCRDHKVPFDFASWHGYASDPFKLLENIEIGIAALKEFGFEDVETHFTEWNYLPPGTWSGGKTREESRENYLQIRAGAGAAFVVSTLAYMQESELDVACFYAAFGSIFRFGMFDRYGVPSKQFYAFKAFNQLVQCGTQISTSGNKYKEGVSVMAAVDTTSGKTVVLISNFKDEASRFNLELKHLPFNERLYCSEYIIDDNRKLEWDREQILNSGDFSLSVELPKESVRMLLFTTESQKNEQ